MQKDLEANYPHLDIEILGINHVASASGNAENCSGRDIPWLQDIDNNEDTHSDTWVDWNVMWRDVVFLDGKNNFQGYVNLTENDLRISEAYDGLLQIFVDIASTFEADFDYDSDVDGDDFLIWQNNFPISSGVTKMSGDANADGDVDGNDFLIWQNQFPAAVVTSFVPEPSTVLLLSLGGMGFLRRFKIN